MRVQAIARGVLKELGSGKQGELRVLGINAEPMQKKEVEGIAVDQDGPGVECLLSR